MWRSVAKDPVIWVVTLGFALAAVLAGLAGAGTGAGSRWAGTGAVAVAVIGGGLLSADIALIARKLDQETQAEDLRCRLADEIGLNVVWARYNRAPLVLAPDQPGNYVLVSFKAEALSDAMSHRSLLRLDDGTWWTLLQVADRVHSFNDVRERLLAEDSPTRAVYRTLGVSSADALSDSMKKHAEELYSYYFPLLIGEMPHTGSAKLQYREIFPDATQMETLATRRTKERKGQQLPTLTPIPDPKPIV